MSKPLSPVNFVEVFPAGESPLEVSRPSAGVAEHPQALGAEHSAATASTSSGGGANTRSRDVARATQRITKVEKGWTGWGHSNPHVLRITPTEYRKNIRSRSTGS